MVDTSGFWIIVSDNNQNCKEAEEILINQRYNFKITNIKSISLDDYFILCGGGGDHSEGAYDNLPLIYLNGSYFGSLYELIEYVNLNYENDLSYFNNFLNPHV
jgi:hypothetical protein